MIPLVEGGRIGDVIGSGGGGAPGYPFSIEQRCRAYEAAFRSLSHVDVDIRRRADSGDGSFSVFKSQSRETQFCAGDGGGGGGVDTAPSTPQFDCDLGDGFSVVLTDSPTTPTSCDTVVVDTPPLIDFIPQLAWAVDALGNVIAENAVWDDFARRGGPRLPMHDWWRLIVHEEDLDALMSRWRTCDLCRPCGFQLQCRIKDLLGDYKWFLMRGAHLLPATDIAQWIGTCTNVDQLKLAELAREQQERNTNSTEHRLLQSSMEQMPVAAAVSGADGEIVLANRRLTETWSTGDPGTTDMEDYLNRRAYHKDGRLYKSSDWPITRCVQSGEVVVDEDMTSMREDGNQRTLSVSCTPILEDHSGKIIGAAAVTRDITQIRQLESEALGRRNREQAFVANISHEFRTPLNGIMGMTDLILGTPLTEEQTGMMDAVRSSGRMLVGVINNVLDFMKMEAGKFELHSQVVEVRELIGGVEAAMREQVGDSPITLELDVASAVPKFVRGDAARIKQLLSILVGNAIKFTERGIVSLSLRLAAVQPVADFLKLEIKVRDTGIGLSPHHQQRLFSPFMQADSSSTREFGGTGLGLPICKRLATLMNGTLELEQSQLHQGSTFLATIQVAVIAGQQQTLLANDPPKSSARMVPKKSVGAIKASAADTESMADIHVLVAEDNYINRMVIKRVLEKFGVRNIVEAVDGMVAVAEYQNAPPDYFDMVLCDCQMPNMDGYTATRNIRNFERDNSRKRVPIIALTSNTMKEDIEACFGCGMDDHIAKPFSQTQILELLDRLQQDRDEPCVESL